MTDNILNDTCRTRAFDAHTTVGDGLAALSFYLRTQCLLNGTPTTELDCLEAAAADAVLALWRHVYPLDHA